MQHVQAKANASVRILRTCVALEYLFMCVHVIVYRGCSTIIVYVYVLSLMIVSEYLNRIIHAKC